MVRALLFSAAFLASAPIWALLGADEAAEPAQEAPRPAPAVILDPGHGGRDLGAVVAGRREKDIALAIANKLRERLEARGAGPVRMTRDSDVYIPLYERVEDGVEWS